MFGALALVAGVISVGGIRNEAAASDWTGLLLVPTGVALLGLAAWVPWHERGRWAATRRRRVNRAIAVVAGALLLFYVVVPVSAALWTTQKFRTGIGTFAVPHEDVTLRTSDRLELSGWYVPSRNGAAVLLVHGGGGSREGAERHAALLARAGYGALLYDARGRGKSEGSTDAFGWTWGRDVDAALSWLRSRPDVEGGRIGALGLSTGADVLVEAAARHDGIRAVVADGATNRSVADVTEVARGGDWLALPFYVSLYGASEIFLGARPGPPLVDLAAQVPPTPILFIASDWAVERQVAPVYARAAQPSSALWEVDAGHTQGLEARPVEYERRVIGFFDEALLSKESEK